MPLIWADRVRETSATSGTGAITPSGAYGASFQTIGSVMSASDTAYFTVVDGAGNWNTFLGTWNGTTVARTTIYAGSSGVSAVNLSGSGVEIWIDAPATWIGSRAGMGDLPKSTKTTNYTIVTEDRGTVVEFTGSTASTFTLPSAATVGAGWYCIVKHSGSGTTADTKKLAFSGTLDGVTNPAAYPGDTRVIQSDGAALTSILLAGGYVEILLSDSPHTLVIPTGACSYEFEAWGAGSGGGSGRRGAAASARGGGSGGGGGTYSTLRAIYAGIGAASLTCTVGAGGGGGAAITVDSTGGANGTAGGNTTVGALLTAYRGGPGLGGGTANSSGGSGGGALGTGATGSTLVTAGGPPSLNNTGGLDGHFGGGGGRVADSGAPGGWGGGAGGGSGPAFGSASAGGSSFRGGGGGGSGGPITSGNIAVAGSNGGGTSGWSFTGGAGGGVGLPGSNGAAGPSALGAGTGGGGGGGVTGAAAGAGGDGGIACGGGGGGASENGFNSGAGGSGGNGLIRFRYNP